MASLGPGDGKGKRAEAFGDIRKSMESIHELDALGQQVAHAVRGYGG